ncbi:MAG: tail protein X [Aeromonas veronii]
MSGKTLTYEYPTKSGEMLDEIVFRHYGKHAPLSLVLEANPGLAKRGPVLPEGIIIVLPSLPVAEKKYISLWG